MTTCVYVRSVTLEDNAQTIPMIALQTPVKTIPRVTIWLVTIDALVCLGTMEKIVLVWSITVLHTRVWTKGTVRTRLTTISVSAILDLQEEIVSWKLTNVYPILAVEMQEIVLIYWMTSFAIVRMDTGKLTFKSLLQNSPIFICT